MNKEWLEAENDLLKKRVYEGNQREKSYVKYLETYKQALLDIKEYIKENREDGFDEDGYDDAWYDKVLVQPILDIINKALEDKEDNTITLNTKDMNITGGKYER